MPTIDEARAAATALWATWSSHETQTQAWLQQLNDHDGVRYVAVGGTAGELLRERAAAADSAASALEVEAVGESVVLRSGPQVEGQRAIWIGVAGPRAGTRWHPPRTFLLSVDGSSWGEGAMSAHPDGQLDWAVRTFPASAVVAITGQSVHWVDNPVAA